MAVRRRVVITGYGLLTPIGLTGEIFWRNLMEGKSGAGPITRFNPSRYLTTIAAQINDFCPEDYMDKKDVKRMDRFSQMGLVAAKQAIEHADLNLTGFLGERAGVMVGTGSGGLQMVQKEYERVLNSGPGKLSPYLAPAMLSNMASGEIAIATGAKGPSAAVVTACATASSCIGEAMRTIQYGTAEVMLAGGTEAPITPLGLAAFSKIRALSRRNEDPARASRPFDRNRDGFVAGEGAGVLVLEELEHARKRNVPILAELIGYGATTDAYHITSPPPDGSGAAKAMQLALSDAGLTVGEIDYINAHGTGTPLNDWTETLAVKRVFGEMATKIPMSSIKSMTGHLLGAAGAIELVSAIMTLQHGWIPPTINWEAPDNGADLDYVPNVPRQKNCRIVMSNSFGFGGHNVSLVVKKWEGE
ncbi:beta-ketoacyl-ACP synthase II [Paenactinomyces guangxiensis]|uniref:3-oxoacyl-[acyl-carrier-protein] synthase 2 n=1 Tax=Paenactinomyces guangxiensis TaxID=1490290 RepID=A0A7W2A6X1_9BACL|nr:beta-ketoacyl-ACP synthase II [Paenactinomyces guangxiensis]MBA4492965.1 beta-ketoacyl-ACP synthase II [Paenactinomyces guangxiensis]MBH8590186.1 beta-ketoacyl-ACP synthase II [Paenactinomyces guangxiensis]